MLSASNKEQIKPDPWASDILHVMEISAKLWAKVCSWSHQHLDTKLSSGQLVAHLRPGPGPWQALWRLSATSQQALGLMQLLGLMQMT